MVRTMPSVGEQRSILIVDPNAAIRRMLEVHLNLWTTAANFQRAYPVWMEGPLLNLSPEQVEADVASWSRQLYKMGKTLVGLDGPLKVVAHVKLKLDEVSENPKCLHSLGGRLVFLVLVGLLL
mgnify:CR=1 FL=1